MAGGLKMNDMKTYTFTVFFQTLLLKIEKHMQTYNASIIVVQEYNPVCLHVWF